METGYGSSPFNCSQTQDGHMSKEDKVKLDAIAQLVVSTDLLVTVAKTGDDGNAGTSASPILTFGEAVKRFGVASWLQRGVLQLKKTGSTMTSYAASTTFDPVFGGYKGDLGSPLVIIGERSNEFGDLAATAADAFSVTSNTLSGLTVDGYRGEYSVLIVSGTGVGQSRKVEFNTAIGQFFVNVPFSPAPVVGSVFRVSRPLVELTFSDTATWVFESSGVGFKDIKLRFTAAGKTMGFTDGTRLMAMEGCTIDLNAGTLALRRNGTGQFSSQTGPWSSDGANNPFSALRLSDGCYIKNGTVNVDDAFGIRQSYLVFDDVAWNINQGADVTMLVPCSKRSELDVTGDLTVTGVAGKITQFDAQKTASPTRGIINVVNGGRILGFGTGQIDVSNSGGHGVLVDSGGRANLGTGATPNISGTGNVSLGLRVRDGGRVLTPPSGITLTGTGGDLQVGTRAVRTWADYNGTAPVLQESDILGDGSRVSGIGVPANMIPLLFDGDGTLLRFRSALAVASGELQVPLAGAIALYDATSTCGMFADATQSIYYGSVVYMNLGGVEGFCGMITGTGGALSWDATRARMTSPTLAGVMQVDDSTGASMAYNTQYLRMGGEITLGVNSNEVMKATTPGGARSVVQFAEGLELNFGAALPAAAAAYRGRVVTIRGAAGVADVTYQCLKDAADAYSWKVIATG